MFNGEKRFVIYQEKTGFEKNVTILLDLMTGVQYLAYRDGYAGGLTPLLDSEGKIVVQQLSEEDELDDA